MRNILLVPLLLPKHRWPVEAWARAQKVCCGVWHHYVSSRSFRFYEQKDVIPAYPTGAQLDWYLELVLFKPYLTHNWLSMNRCTGSLGGGTSQSSIHTNGFLAEHWPKNHSASTGLFSSHNASWFYVFPRLATPMHQVIHVIYVPIVSNSRGGQEPPPLSGLPLCSLIPNKLGWTDIFPSEAGSASPTVWATLAYVLNSPHVNP